jgi:hypothetical protein
LVIYRQVFHGVVTNAIKHPNHATTLDADVYAQVRVYALFQHVLLLPAREAG